MSITYLEQLHGGDIVQLHPNRDAIIAKMSSAIKALNKKPPNRIRILVNDVIYESYHDASIALGIPIVTIRYRCLSQNIKYLNWYIDGQPKQQSALYKQGDNQGSAINCEGIRFISYADASRYFGLSITAVMNRVKSPNYPDYFKE